MCRDAFTCVLLRGQCAGGCAIAGWRERSGREVRERGGQGSHWVSRRGGPCPPSLALLLPDTLAHSHCRIVIDATSTQRGSGCHHRHECDPKRTCLLLRSEGTRRVAQRRAQNLLAEPAHDPGHWPRSACFLKDAAVESLPPSRRTDA
ncbi:hypothetical protein TcCL_NonESM10624 [Trypanosoma cruzi]|nr:hypothetical protein TcCL_NonESM10624 [Trypanosoma cruzi]